MTTLLPELGRRTLIMGILNVTPDSFSDGGKFNTIDSALQHARQMVADGADIIDIGGESTRPGHFGVSAEEELERVLPVIKALANELTAPISIDTTKSEVAEQALQAGAHILNDIWGFKADRRMAQVAKQYDCPVILMHNRHEAVYQDFIPDVLNDLRDCINLAKEAGIPDHNIWLDPGIGFGKTKDHNLILMNHLREVRNLGFPVLLGTSRKSFIRSTLDVSVEDAVEGTAATVALGIAQGCDIVRVHDVKQMKRVAQMTDAIVRRGQNGG